MPTSNPEIDAYIDRAASFAQPILTHLRRLVHAGCPGVEEVMKWSFPHFMHQGILCSMAAFKEHCSFGFWKAALILESMDQAARDGMGQFGRITRLADLPKDRILLQYIREAVRLNEAGIRVPRKTNPKAPKVLEIPGYFSNVLKTNPKAAATFAALSYSHRKDYLEWLTEAKREETRNKRLATALEWLAEGKPRNWKYQNC
jgi:uncharacterized protein YdeI (YjbR/CyaY-like superfamily)